MASEVESYSMFASFISSQFEVVKLGLAGI